MNTTHDLKRIIASITVTPLNQLAGSIVGARGSRIARTALVGTALAALIAFVAAIQPTPHAQAATTKVAVAESTAAHIRTVADGFLGDIVAVDDDDLVQQQEEEQQQEEQDDEQATQQLLQTDQEIQEAEQEAEEQNQLASQEAQQAEQQGLMDEQQATLSGGQ